MDNAIFRKMSYGVYLLTTMDGERPTGCTVNSVMQITSEPATVAVSVNHNNFTNECIDRSGLFAFHILSEQSDPALIGTFGFQSGRDADKFEGLSWEKKEGVPVLTGGVNGYVVCRVVNRMETSTHTVFLGEVIETDGVEMKFTGTVPSGKVMVDGYGVGDVGSVVLRDRKHLAEDGVMIIVATIDRESGCVLAGPDIVSRGFVYVRESEELIDEAKQLMKQVMDNCRERNIREWGNIKSAMRDALSDYIYSKTKRSPMILPIIMEVQGRAID